MSDSTHPTDPVAACRQWVADNPQAPGAVHVLSALASAERYRLLAEVAQGDGAAGCKIVLGTIASNLTITSTSQKTDEKIAEAIARWLTLIQSVAADAEAAEVEREEPVGLRVASVGDHDLNALREYIGLPVAVLVGSRAHIAAVASLLDRPVMVSEEEWVMPEGKAPSEPETRLVEFMPGNGRVYARHVSRVVQFARGEDGTCAFCDGDPCAEYSPEGSPIVEYMNRGKPGYHPETCPFCEGRAS